MKENIKILIAEDDKNLGLLLNEYLSAKGYETDLFPDGDKAFKGFKNTSYDICILDVMMPIKDGLTLASDIRLIDKKVPIIFLTAKSMKEDVLEGFKAGADDYVAKPFSMEELLMRIDAVLRRTGSGLKEESDNLFEIGKYNFDANKQQLKIGDKISKLTTKESELLRLLCENMNDVLNRNYALKVIWADDNYFNARSMDVYITKLRKQLKEDESIEIINVHGKGFKLLV